MLSSITDLPILSLITYLPLIGAIVLLFVPKDRHEAIRWTAMVFSLLSFIASLWLPLGFNPATHEMQFQEKFDWIPSIGVKYFFGVDGISLWLVLLTTLLTPISILCSWRAIEHRIKEFFVFMLVLETGMLGVFFALDFFLFYIFWEVMLVPMYFLIGVWGSDRRLYSAIKFFLYTLFGSVVMLLGILAIYFYAGRTTGTNTFDVLELMKVAYPTQEVFSLFGIGFSFQDLVWLAFFLSFAIKVPMFPFHTWLPDAHTDAPTAGSVILAGVLLKMGTYGFLRFNLPMFPESTERFVPFVFVLSVIAIVYGAMVCMVQPDMKRLIAYSSVSHMGFVMLGMFALNAQGVQGSLLQMVNHGLSTGALFLIVGLIYDRRHTRLISELGGLSKVMPVYAVLFAIIMLSSMGLPGLNGFIGEFLILLGAFRVSTLWAAVAVTGIILGAAYMLWLYQRTMFGEVENPKNLKLTDLDGREIATLVPIIIMCFWIGLYPTPFLRYMEKSVTNVLVQVETKKGRAPAKAALPGPPPGVRPASAALPRAPSDPLATPPGGGPQAAAGVASPSVPAANISPASGFVPSVAAPPAPAGRR